jgi:ParB family chromosome partitioning protein
MSGSTFAKLVRNIERTGRYEPLIVRPYRRKKGRFQIINGHHRLEAIKKLGKRKAEVIVWDVDDEQTDILLATLNRLSGSDIVAKKIALLKRLTGKMNARQLGRLLPQTPGQIKKLTALLGTLAENWLANVE